MILVSKVKKNQIKSDYNERALLRNGSANATVLPWILILARDDALTCKQSSKL